MQAKQWGVFLCNCRSSLEVDAERIGSGAALVTVATDPKKEIRKFAREADKGDVEQVVVACCADPSLFSDALGARRLSFVDLKNKCFAPHADSRQAHAKAEKMIAAAMRAAEARTDVAQNLLHAGGAGADIRRFPRRAPTGAHAERPGRGYGLYLPGCGGV